MYPFILRGVTLAGVDSVMAPLALRQQAWARLATDLDLAKLAAMTTTIGLAEVPAASRRSSRARCAVVSWSMSMPQNDAGRGPTIATTEDGAAARAER